LKELKDKYSYFNRLEVKIKTAIVFYFSFLIVGLGISGLGIDKILVFIQTVKVEIFVLSILGATALILGAAFWIRTINQVGSFHIVLDTTIFGFLKKSNDTIVQSLLFSLNPEERRLLETTHREKQAEIVQSVFTELSNDSEIFGSMIKSKLFITWTRYWICVYGAITFTVLTIGGFIAVVTYIDSYSKLIFSIYWLLAGVHLSLVIALGYRLSTMTKKSVDTIVGSHKKRIASILRTFLTEGDRVEEADVVDDD
jgi:hypothetical protein